MISKEKVQELIKRAYSIAATHGFHEVDRSNAHFMMLVVSEIGEMVEADRKKCRDYVKFYQLWFGKGWMSRPYRWREVLPEVKF